MAYQKITQAQIEIWLNDPVTKTHLQCLWWSAEQIRELMGKGEFIDRKSMENSYGDTREAAGQIDGLESATDVIRHFNQHEMVDEIDYKNGDQYSYEYPEAENSLIEIPEKEI